MSGDEIFATNLRKSRGLFGVDILFTKKQNTNLTMKINSYTLYMNTIFQIKRNISFKSSIITFN